MKPKATPTEVLAWTGAVKVYRRQRNQWQLIALVSLLLNGMLIALGFYFLYAK